MSNPPPPLPVRALEYDASFDASVSAVWRPLCLWVAAWGATVTYSCLNNIVVTVMLDAPTYGNDVMNYLSTGLDVVESLIGIVVVILAVLLRRPTRAKYIAAIWMAASYVVVSIARVTLDGPLYYLDSHVDFDATVIFSITRTMGYQFGWMIVPLMLGHLAIRRLCATP